MRKQPTLKFVVTRDRIVVELTRRHLLAEVAATNRRSRQYNREDPAEPVVFRKVTDPSKLLKRVYRVLNSRTPESGNPLPAVIQDAIYEALMHAAARQEGVVETVHFPPVSPVVRKQKKQARRRAKSS